MKFGLLAFVVFVCLASLPRPAAARDNPLPADAAEALKTGTRFELFSLFPHGLYDSYPYPKLKPEESFHDFKILGSTDLADVKQREPAVASVQEAIGTFDGVVAGCFEPRHGLRVHTANGVFDFVICFECHWLRLYRGEQYVGMIPIAGSADRLNAILRAGNIPLPQRATAPK